MKRNHFLKVVLAALCAAALVCGCSQNAGTLDQREERDPLLKRARVKKRAQDIDGAIELLNRALERKPQLARAHLELGLIYDGDKEDYVRALYHYERYLELRPNTEKKSLIEDLIRRARLSFAASLPDTPSGAIEEIAELKRENEALRERLDRDVKEEREAEKREEQRQAKLAAARQEAATAGRTEPVRETPAPAPAPKPELRPGPQPVARTERRTEPVTITPAVAPQPAPAQPAVQTYRVQRGDTLSSIAAKMYNDPTKWKIIYEANRATMSRPESIRVGQILIIP